MVLYEKCSFYVPLETGCLIIAFLNLTGSIFGIIISILMTIAGVKYQTSPIVNEVKSGLILVYTGTALIIFFVLSFAFAIVLLVGLNMKKLTHVKAYLKCCVALLIYILLIYAILILVRLLTGSGGVTEGVINLIVSVYFLRVMKNYHQRMLEDKPFTIQNV